jgi:3-hydroxyacyl-[acyl-carrier-protein] dehydratase
MFTIERLFPLDHPAAQGHFPGNPIIPGAVLLSETLRIIEETLALSLWPGHLESAKFPYPTRPGDLVKIEFPDSALGSIKFTCSVGQITVLIGIVICETISTPA